MGKARARKGKSYQGDRPEWGPLLDAVGERVTGDFMWMFEVVLDDGTPLQAYKHIDTRRYVHLAPDGTAFFYEEPDRYRRIAVARVLAEIFVPLPGLAGVTDEQISASWAAVERLEHGHTPHDV
jgi:hypothetical protein